VDIRAYIESGIIESCVLGMASAEEAAELQQLRSRHPEINKAIADFEASLERTAMAGATQPPAYVRTELFTQLAGEFRDTETRGKVVAMSSSRFSKYIAAAAIILLVVSAALNMYFYNRFQSTNTAYQALLVEKTSLIAGNRATQAKVLDMYQGMQMMSDPTVAKISMATMRPNENNLATVFWDTKTKDVYLLPNKMPAAAAGKQYQLWAIVDGKPVDAGMMDVCAGLCKMKNIPRASAFAITLEKKGGSATPTMEQLYVMGKVG
jgi:anti-sigma-K factor RskA